VPKKQTKKRAARVTPLKLIDDLWAARMALALIAGVDLDVFTTVSKGNKTVSEISKSLSVSSRALERLLDSLACMGYLTKRGTRYGLTPVSDTFLVRTKPSYMGAMANETRLTLPQWTQLADIIRRGKPASAINTDEGRQFFPELVRSIFPLTYNAALGLVRSWPQAKLKKIGRVLDVAAGSGAWSLPFAQANPNVRVTAVDYPEVTAITREYAQQFDVADRYDYLEGDLRQIDFGQQEYDVVILGHIIHTEGEKWGKTLVEKSHKALKPGGTLVIAEMIPNDSRTGPVFPLLFGLMMTIVTEEGDVFTLAEYKKWLKQTGFRAVKLVQVEAPSPLILATR
jgi:3-hydroxy-5-methyl-1-naphthoate 3-O-methyltransferase